MQFGKSFKASSASSQRKRVVLLGATGSIGENTLRVLTAHPDKLELVGIAAHSQWEKLAAIARQFDVRHIGVFDDTAFAAARALPAAFPPGTRLVGGLAGLVELHNDGFSLAGMSGCLGSRALDRICMRIAPLVRHLEFDDFAFMPQQIGRSGPTP